MRSSSSGYRLHSCVDICVLSKFCRPGCRRICLDRHSGGCIWLNEGSMTYTSLLTRWLSILRLDLWYWFDVIVACSQWQLSRYRGHWCCVNKNPGVLVGVLPWDEVILSSGACNKSSGFQSPPSGRDELSDPLTPLVHNSLHIAMLANVSVPLFAKKDARQLLEHIAS